MTRDDETVIASLSLAAVVVLVLIAAILEVCRR